MHFTCGMILLLLVFWLLPFWSLQLDLEPWLKEVSVPLQQWCAAQVPEGASRSLTTAMVCGISPGWNDSQVFRQSGLYHLLVVSGGHLAFVVDLLARLPRSWWTRALMMFALSGYALLCGAQPPVIRALVQLALDTQAPRFGWKQNPWLSGWIAGVVCLALLPHWIHSLSFWLSWLASLSCGIAAHLRLRGVRSVTFTHILLLPALAGLGAAHPLGVICNWLLGPVLSRGLFPLCALVCLIPPLSGLAEIAWAGTLALLEPLARLTPPTEMTIEKSILLIYTASLQLAIWQGGIWWRRRCS